MAHKKAGGSTRNGRDSNPKYLGVKRYGGEASARMEARVKDALESAEDPRDALLDIRAKVRQRRGA